MLHYNPGHVLSINMPIMLIHHTLQPFTESDDISFCDNIIYPPEDGHVNARNMLRI
jgi:hypothetical protein